MRPWLRQRNGRGVAVFALFAIAAVTSSSFAQSTTKAGAATGELNRYLDAEKPDATVIQDLTARARQPPPPDLTSAATARFYQERAGARARLNDWQGVIDDCREALKAARGNDVMTYPVQVLLGWALFSVGDQAKNALAVFTALERDADKIGTKGWVFTARRGIAVSSIALGDVRRAEQALARSRTMFVQARNWPVFDQFGQRWLAQVEATAAAVAIANKDYERAEASARSAETILRRLASARGIAREEQAVHETLADIMVTTQATAKLDLGRLAEAENDFRSAVVSRIRTGGKYQVSVADFLSGVRRVKFLQGRYEDALQINGRIFDILDQLGIAKSSIRYVRTLNAQAWTLLRLGRAQEAEEFYRRVEAATETWPVERRVAARNPIHRVSALINTGRSEEALKPAEALLARMTTVHGADSAEAAYARADLGAVLSRAGNVSDALVHFRKALPIIHENAAEERDDIDSGGTRGLDQPSRIATINYLYAISLDAKASQSEIDEAFRFAERIRSDSVQRALLAASTRSALRDPAIAPVIRREQDLEKEVGSAVDALRAGLAQEPDQRDEQAIAAHRKNVAELRKRLSATRSEVDRKAPKYRELLSPAPPRIADVQALLRPGEVFVSIIGGEYKSFVFVIPRQGNAKFFRAEIGRSRTNELVARVRGGLTMGGEALVDVPEFDILAASALYEHFLKPAEALLDEGDRLLVAADGSLAGLPFGLLTRRAPQIDASAEPMFSAYRSVPWLIRTHAITVLPSAATLRSLRSAAAPRRTREAFIGFGDPIFNREQLAQSVASGTDPATEIVATRGGPATKLTFRNLPRPPGEEQGSLKGLQRLPDTAIELKSIAAATGAKPERVLLRMEANEAKVMGMDLSAYRIVAFATHGLVPGDVPGLRTPALALTAPDIAGVTGDGLLTMEEILQLKLDADWVVLSACNTGAGIDGSDGTEAASGLGRAFFFAGSRALLVTGWPVHSVSARELMVDLFERQGKEPQIERAKALQQAMVHLMDKGAIMDVSGQPVASYAHPVFWAPYLLIGDGGASR